MSVVALQNMIDHQLRPYKVSSERVLSAFAAVDRENFLPLGYRAVAYTDVQLPIGDGQTMLSPQQQAYVLQTLAIEPTDRVLEIGTGLGYFTALLAQFAASVYSVDANSEFIARAHSNLAKQAVNNVSLLDEDVLQDWQKVADQGPFDVIVSNGAFYTLPTFLLDSLHRKGRLFAIIGKAPTMSASVFKRQNSDHWQEHSLFETAVNYIPNLIPTETFVF